MSTTATTAIRRLGHTGSLPAAAAVLLWSLAPTLGELARSVPPLQLTALCFAVASVMTAPVVYRKGRTPSVGIGAVSPIWLMAPLLMVGAVGCYFWGLAHAPAGNVTLVTYVWPVLFVVATEILALGRVRTPVVVGCLLAFAGAGLLLLSEGAALQASWAGYAAGISSGLSWVGFSLLARRQAVPLAGVLPVLCMLAALWATLVHGLTEPTLWRLAGHDALWIVLIGAGPYGLAFLLWDYALRRGPGATVGTMAYAVPVLSAAVLLVTGFAALRWQLPVAAAMVMTGCVVASRTSAASGHTARMRA